MLAIWSSNDTCPQCGKSLRSSEKPRRLQSVIFNDKTATTYHAACIRLAKIKNEPIKLPEEG